jgi:hypothetical protein
MSSTTHTRQVLEVQPLPRCCPSHQDWATLAQHLVDGFPELAIGDVVRQLRAARDAVTDAALAEADALEMAELIARQQLHLLAGHAPDVARLNPERHERRVTA